jgi:hypothetical protein
MNMDLDPFEAREVRMRRNILGARGEGAIIDSQLLRRVFDVSEWAHVIENPDVWHIRQP